MLAEEVQLSKITCERILKTVCCGAGPSISQKYVNKFEVLEFVRTEYKLRKMIADELNDLGMNWGNNNRKTSISTEYYQVDMLIQIKKPPQVIVLCCEGF